MTTPEQHANIVRSLKGRLYAALGHEKSCVCGECSGGLNAVDDLAALANRADTLERERDAERREADVQMGEKLAAQMTLKAVCDVLDLPMVSLGNGWTEATPKILARIETIVDEAERGFTAGLVAFRAEADRLQDALREIDAVVKAWANDETPEADHPFDADMDFLNYVGHVARAALAGPQTISDEGMIQPNYRPGDLDAGPQTKEQT